MTESEKQEILNKVENTFKETIAQAHLKNLRKLKKLKEFSYNPFLLEYLANFLTGQGDAESMARALVYPRILGTSIVTSFGMNIQTFTSHVLKTSAGSVVSGIDIEFIDQIDKRKKYCQLKSGPNTINNDDIVTIRNHFSSIQGLARQNHLDVRVEDLVIGVMYGTQDELSANYRTLAKDFTVLVGEDFWHRFTGDIGFYKELIERFGLIAKQADTTELLEEVIHDLAKEIQKEIIDKQIEV